MAIFKKNKAPKSLEKKINEKPQNSGGKKIKKKEHYDSLAMKYGVDPILGKKVKKNNDKPTFFKLLKPRNLQTEVSKYGYSFSSKRFYLSVLAAMAIAIGVGFLFQLKWYFNLVIILTCIL